MSKIEVKILSDIAEEVKRLDSAMQAIKQSNLTEEAIVILLANLTKENKGTIKNVLWGLANIKKYLK